AGGRGRAATGFAGLVAGAPLRRLRRPGRSQAIQDDGGDATNGPCLRTRPRGPCPRFHMFLGRARLRLLGSMTRSGHMRMIGALTLAVLLVASAPNAGGETRPPASSPPVAVGPQYDTTHVYVAPEDFDRFVARLLATFGGTTSKQGVFTVTPTPSSTMNQLVLTPVGTLSVFGFKTPVPYPFGAERTGYLVTDMDGATRTAVKDGADVLVSPFNDPIGRDVVIQWPGGVNMQLYWHTTVPNYPPLQTVPENRVYLSPDSADVFIRDFVAFAHGKIISDDRNAPGVEIGRPTDT